MRTLLLTGAIVAGFYVAHAAAAGDGSLIRATLDARSRAWSCADHLGIPRRPSTDSFRRRAASLAYRKWVYRLWDGRARARCGLLARLRSDPRAAICFVFGPVCAEALHVAACETGETFSTRAANGQYRGLFQMGEWARSRYGHADDALGQARAAHRLYRDEGWSQWECSPRGAFRD